MKRTPTHPNPRSPRNAHPQSTSATLTTMKLAALTAQFAHTTTHNKDEKRKTKTQFGAPFGRRTRTYTYTFHSLLEYCFLLWCMMISDFVDYIVDPFFFIYFYLLTYLFFYSVIQISHCFSLHYNLWKE